MKEQSEFALRGRSWWVLLSLVLWVSEMSSSEEAGGLFVPARDSGVPVPASPGRAQAPSENTKGKEEKKSP